ncbi:hypothetical protein EB155_07810 [archaeon]|nr:hypothetical protein [archaeon]NDB79759.1 hypothetical protein [archaeon]
MNITKDIRITDTMKIKITESQLKKLLNEDEGYFDDVMSNIKKSIIAISGVLRSTSNYSIDFKNLTTDVNSQADGSHNIDCHVDIEILSYVDDPDGQALGEELKKINNFMYDKDCFLYKVVLDSDGKIKRLSSNESTHDYDTYWWLSKVDFEHIRGDKNLKVTYNYNINVWIEEENED